MSTNLSEKDIIVTKRDGTQENWDPDKIYKYVKMACDGTNISPSQVMLDVDIKLQRRMKTSDIQDTMIKSVVDSITSKPKDIDNQMVAAKLLNQKIRKDVYKHYMPLPFYDEIVKRVRRKWYDNNITDMYTEEEINMYGEYIKFERDDLFTYTGLLQMHKKYLIRNKHNVNIETPQESFMLIGMYIFAQDKNRESLIKIFYDKLSTLKLILSTPIASGVRTTLRMYSSCAGLQVTDSEGGVAQSFEDIYKLTLNRAGIGANYGHIRGAGADIDKGREKHTGIIPLLKVAEKISLSAMQPGAGRGGAITQYYPYFHYEIMDLLELKNNKGTDDNRVRQSDHAIIFNKLFYDRLEKDEDITLFYINDVGDLYDWIGDDKYFQEKYVELENKRGISKKKIPARELYKKYWIERIATGRYYKVNADAFQTHSAFKVPVYNSNLCLAGDTQVQTQDGIKSLQDVKVGDKVYSRNTDTGEDEYKLVTDSALMNNESEVYEIEDDNGNTIRCTADHKIWTENRGYVLAKELEETDILKSI
jgi:ribonucleoside-diphosphate reductase alpha chain